MTGWCHLHSCRLLWWWLLTPSPATPFLALPPSARAVSSQLSRCSSGQPHNYVCHEIVVVWDLPHSSSLHLSLYYSPSRCLKVKRRWSLPFWAKWRKTRLKTFASQWECGDGAQVLQAPPLLLARAWRQPRVEHRSIRGVAWGLLREEIPSDLLLGADGRKGPRARGTARFPQHQCKCFRQATSDSHPYPCLLAAMFGRIYTMKTLVSSTLRLTLGQWFCWFACNTHLTELCYCCCCSMLSKGHTNIQIHRLLNSPVSTWVRSPPRNIGFCRSQVRSLLGSAVGKLFPICILHL